MSIQRLLILVAAVFSSIFLFGSRGWNEPVQGAQDEKGSKGGGSEDVTLRIAGDEGTRFSGTCSVGQEEHDISGRAPRSFRYEPNNRKLVCEVRKQGAQNAELKVVLEDGNTRSVQRSEGGEDTTIRLVFKNDTLSSSVSSSSSQNLSSIGSSSSSTANDDARGVDGESSSSSSENEAERSGNGRESLADQIQRRVDVILERALP